VLIDDVAEVATRVIYSKSVGILNVATGIITSFRDIADAVVRSTDRALPVEEMARNGPMPQNEDDAGCDHPQLGCTQGWIASLNGHRRIGCVLVFSGEE
jgi:hypothetical protein